MKSHLKNLSSLFVASLFFSLSALAMPKVGDRSVYDIVATDASGVSTPMGQITGELISFDAATRSFVQRTTTAVLGQPVEIEDDRVDIDDLYSEAELRQGLADCVSDGGIREIVVVAGNPLDTCKFDDGSTIEWFGLVPFAYVKQVEIDSDGSKITITLNSYTIAP